LSFIGSLANDKNTNFCRKWGGRSQDFPLYLFILSLCLNFLLNTIFFFVKLPFTASTCISELVIYGPRSKHPGCVLRILTILYFSCITVFWAKYCLTLAIYKRMPCLGSPFSECFASRGHKWSTNEYPKINKRKNAK
jgi:hypothetical protein